MLKLTAEQKLYNSAFDWAIHHQEESDYADAAETVYNCLLKGGSLGQNIPNALSVLHTCDSVEVAPFVVYLREIVGKVFFSSCGSDQQIFDTLKAEFIAEYERVVEAI